MSLIMLWVLLLQYKPHVAHKKNTMMYCDVVTRIEHKFSEFTIVTLWVFPIPLPLLLSMDQSSISEAAEIIKTW